MTDQKKEEEQIKSKFETVEEHPSFPKNEEQIILFWREIRAFETQLEKTKNCPVYTFMMVLLLQQECLTMTT